MWVLTKDCAVCIGEWGKVGSIRGGTEAPLLGILTNEKKNVKSRNTGMSKLRRNTLISLIGWSKSTVDAS